MLFVHQILSASSLYIHWRSRLSYHSFYHNVAKCATTQLPKANVSLQLSCQKIFKGKLQLVIASCLIWRIRKIRNPFQLRHDIYVARQLLISITAMEISQSGRFDTQQWIVQPRLASCLWRSAPFPFKAGTYYSQSISFERFCCKCQSQ